MSSDLERIRLKLLEDLAQKSKESGEKGKIENEARALARRHLPMWIESIERAVRRKEPFPLIFYYVYWPGFLWGGSYEWWEENSSSGPRIDLNATFKVPMDTYIDELNKLFGTLFRVQKCFDENIHHSFEVEVNIL